MMNRVLGVALLVVTVCAQPATTAQQKPERMRITSASHVRVRVEPSIEVKIVATLPLGTDLVELETSRDGQWVRARTPAGVEGWISADLTQPVPAGERDRVVREVVQFLNRAGLQFDAGVELVDLIEQLQKRTSSPSESAKLELFRLQALGHTARAGSTKYRPSPASVAAWYDARASLLVFNEPGGLWMLRHEVILAEADRFRGTPAAQEIAWLAVTTDLPGECEGDIPCYAGRHDRLQGEYLRRYPAGTFAESAFQRLLDRAIAWQLMMQDSRVFTTGDCGRLKAPLASLRAAVADAAPPSYARALQARTVKELDAVAQVCR